MFEAVIQMAVHCFFFTSFGNTDAAFLDSSSNQTLKVPQNTTLLYTSQENAY